MRKSLLRAGRSRDSMPCRSNLETPMKRANRKVVSGASLCILCLVILAGCFPRRVDTAISAYAQQELGAKKRFVLQGPDPRLPGGDPAWPTYAKILTRALEAKGFVPDAGSPDLII